VKRLLALVLSICLTLSCLPFQAIAVEAEREIEVVTEPVAEVTGREERGISLPIRPRRCHRLQLKLAGVGDAKLYSLTKTFAKGSELL